MDLEKIRDEYLWQRKTVLLANLLYFILGIIFMVIGVILKVSAGVGVMFVALGIYCLIASIVFLLVPRQIYNSMLLHKILEKNKK